MKLKILHLFLWSNPVFSLIPQNGSLLGLYFTSTGLLEMMSKWTPQLTHVICWIHNITELGSIGSYKTVTCICILQLGGGPTGDIVYSNDFCRGITQFFSSHIFISVQVKIKLMPLVILAYIWKSIIDFPSYFVRQTAWAAMFGIQRAWHIQVSYPIACLKKCCWFKGLYACCHQKYQMSYNEWMNLKIALLIILFNTL